MNVMWAVSNQLWNMIMVIIGEHVFLIVHVCHVCWWVCINYLSVSVRSEWSVNWHNIDVGARILCLFHYVQFNYTMVHSDMTDPHHSPFSAYLVFFFNEILMLQMQTMKILKIAPFVSVQVGITLFIIVYVYQCFRLLVHHEYPIYYWSSSTL